MPDPPKVAMSSWLGTGDIRAGFWGYVGREGRVHGSEASPKCPGLSARAVWDRILVRAHEVYGQHRPRTGPGSPPPWPCLRGIMYGKSERPA